MKKFFKWTGIIVGILVIILITWGVIAHEPLPQGQDSPLADGLARRMLTAIDKPAWDSTAVIRWNFGGRHDFVWDRTRHLVEVSWNNKRVLLDPGSVRGIAYVDGEQLTGESATKLVRTAWDHFNNDSFWLNAPAKVFDPGVSRKVVIDPETQKTGLLVTYASGGTTPGDSYLWWLDDSGQPNAWQMWVQMIPVGGIRATWQNWTTLPSGARISTEHEMGQLTLKLSDIKSGQSLAEVGAPSDLFAPLLDGYPDAGR